MPWQAITQIMLLGCRRPDGSAYTVLPDVMVFARPMATTIGSYSPAVDGPPALIIEVASEPTYEADLDLEKGNAWSYRQAGVREYLVLDPPGEWVTGGGRGWRLEGGGYRPWRPDRARRWRSATFGVALGVDDGRAAVYGADGRRRLREGEIEAALIQRFIEGQQTGQQEGLRTAVRQVARLRFGVVARLEARIDQAAEDELTAMLGRLMAAPVPDDL